MLHCHDLDGDHILGEERLLRLHLNASLTLGCKSAAICDRQLLLQKLENFLLQKIENFLFPAVPQPTANLQQPATSLKQT